MNPQEMAGMDQADLERKKARMFLDDFLAKETPMTPDGRAYDPVGKDWTMPVMGMMGSPIIQAPPQQPPMPMSPLQQAQNILPDFFDDQFMDYATFMNALSGGGRL